MGDLYVNAGEHVYLDGVPDTETGKVYLQSPLPAGNAMLLKTTNGEVRIEANGDIYANKNYLSGAAIMPAAGAEAEANLLGWQGNALFQADTRFTVTLSRPPYAGGKADLFDNRATTAAQWPHATPEDIQIEISNAPSTLVTGLLGMGFVTGHGSVATSYKLEYSLDGTNWVTLADVTVNSKASVVKYATTWIGNPQRLRYTIRAFTGVYLYLMELLAWQGLIYGGAQPEYTFFKDRTGGYLGIDSAGNVSLAGKGNLTLDANRWLFLNGVTTQEKGINYDPGARVLNIRNDADTGDARGIYLTTKGGRVYFDEYGVGPKAYFVTLTGELFVAGKKVIDNTGNCVTPVYQ